MSHLTNIEFKKYIKRLELTQDSQSTYLQDEVGEVAIYWQSNREFEFNNAFVDDVEYAFNDKQKELLKNVLLKHNEECSEAFNDADYTHFTNLIYS